MMTWTPIFIFVFCRLKSRQAILALMTRFTMPLDEPKNSMISRTSKQRIEVDQISSLTACMITSMIFYLYEWYWRSTTRSCLHSSLFLTSKSFWLKFISFQIFKTLYRCCFETSDNEKHVIRLLTIFPLSGWKRGTTVYKLLCRHSFQSQYTVSHAYHCLAITWDTAANLNGSLFSCSDNRWDK